MIYYIYEVLGHKVGATKDWLTRSIYNFNKYGIQPIVIETMEGPDEPEFWQVVGDREWELADLNGYPRGVHYRIARERRHKWNDNFKQVASKEACIAGGRITGRMNVESGHLAKVRDPQKAWQASLKRIICKHCGKDANTGNYTRWHGDNCKHKKSLN